MSTEVGNQAESSVCDYLIENSFTIIERNWRTRMCEIDIIARKNDVTYFVEVKYRSTEYQGGGLEYITPKKLHQMQFAAQCWVQEHNYEGDWELSGVEVASDFVVARFEPSIT